MSNLIHGNQISHRTTTCKVGDAVGVPNEEFWFVAIVNNNSEKKCVAQLSKMGYESFALIQKETRTYSNGRKKNIDIILLPAMIFIRCSEEKRRKEIVTMPLIKRFLVNRAGEKNEFKRNPLAIIPDNQIERLTRLLQDGPEKIIIEQDYFCVGEYVIVKEGSLKGLIGNIVQDNSGSSYIVVTIDNLGCAKMRINTESVERYVESANP